MRHAISWFELPVTDLDRAATFYGAILGSKLGEVTRAEDRLYVIPSRGRCRRCPGSRGGLRAQPERLSALLERG